MVTISVNTAALHHTVFLFPVCAGVALFLVFVISGHFSSGCVTERGVLRLFDASLAGAAEFMVPFPESRLFGVAMAIEAALLAAALAVRVMVIDIRAQRSLTVLRTAMRALCAAAPLGLFVLGACGPDEAPRAHAVGKALFFGSGAIACIASDIALHALKMAPRIGLTFAVTVAIVMECVLVPFDGSAAKSMRAFADCAAFVLLFAKFGVFALEAPRHCVSFTVLN